MEGSSLTTGPRGASVPPASGKPASGEYDARINTPPAASDAPLETGELPGPVSSALPGDTEGKARRGHSLRTEGKHRPNRIPNSRRTATLPAVRRAKLRAKSLSRGSNKAKPTP